MQDSWVDLGTLSSRGSTGSLGFQHAIIAADTSNVNSNKGSRLSPKSLNSPCVEVNPMLEAVKYKLVRECRPVCRDTDWLWDWSSRPEVIPPKQYRFRHPGGTMTTPPNSPIQSPGGTIRCSTATYTLSLRHSKVIRYDLCSVEVVSLFIVSNVLSLCIGYWICQKLTSGLSV